MWQQSYLLLTFLCFCHTTLQTTTTLDTDTVSINTFNGVDGNIGTTPAYQAYSSESYVANTEDFSTLPSETIVEQVSIETLWSRARAIEDDVATLIPGWYPYEYDGSEEYGIRRIRYGGSIYYPIFLYGNEVRFYKGPWNRFLKYSSPILYNSNNSYEDYDIQIGGSWHPFMTLSWIRNPTEAHQLYTFQINGYVSSSEKSQVSGNGTLTSSDGLASVQYHYYHIYGSDDPTVCEIYALISSRSWGSKVRSRFLVHQFSPIGKLENSVRLQGNPKNVLMSYILLSKRDGVQITQVEIERFLNRLTQYITQGVDGNIGTTPAYQAHSSVPYVAITEDFATSPSETIVEQVSIKTLWRRARDIKDDMATLIPGWYPYEYDGSDTNGVLRIRYGGSLLNPLYFHGNEVRFYKGDWNQYLKYSSPILYNSKNSYEDYDIQIGGRWRPFMALLWIRNPTEAHQMYTFQINGYVSSSRKNKVSGNGTLTSSDGLASVQYHYYHIYGSDDPTVCEIYALISSKSWGSKVRSRFLVHQFSPIGELENSVRLQGNPKNVLMSYILLSKRDGVQITQVEIERFLNRLTQYITQVTMEPIISNTAASTPLTTSPGFTTATPTTTLMTPSHDNQVVRIGIKKLWRRAREIKDDMATLIPGWYPYEYDGIDDFGVNQIQYGGSVSNPLYLDGNKVRFYRGDREPSVFNTTPVWYNSRRRNADYDIQIGGSWLPFIAMSWIRNPTEVSQIYTFQVRGHVPNSPAKIQVSGSGNLTSTNEIVSVQYHYYHIYGGSDPSVCEIYALISAKSWGSKVRSRFFVHHFSPIGNLANSVRLQGNPKNILMSYLLLSKSNGGRITQVEIERFLNRFTQYITQATTELITTTTITATTTTIPTTTTTTVTTTIPTTTATTVTTTIPTTTKTTVTTTIPTTTTAMVTTTIPTTTTTTTSQTTSTEENHGCVYSLPATSFAQYIHSPGWPKTSPKNLNCYWHIRGPPGSQIDIFVKSLNVDPANSLFFIENGHVIRRLSGLYTIWNHPRLRTLTSTGSTLTLNYKTPSSYYSAVGFRLTFRAIGDYKEEVAAVCPDWSYKATSIPQHIQSTGYPNNYPDDLNETYYICGPPGSQIFVQLVHFDTEACCDYLQYIINGSQVQSIKGINKVRSAPWLRNFTSPGSNLTLRFITNFIGSAWGFDVTYQAIGDFEEPATNSTGTTAETTTDQPAPARCGDRLTATSTPQPIKSPGRPSYYPRDLRCYWYIYAPAGSQISLKFGLLDIDSYDYLTISDEKRRFRYIRGSYSRYTFKSPGSTVILYFSTDSIGASYGFELTYRAIGGTTSVPDTTAPLDPTSSP